MTDLITKVMMHKTLRLLIRGTLTNLNKKNELILIKSKLVHAYCFRSNGSNTLLHYIFIALESVERVNLLLNRIDL